MPPTSSRSLDAAAMLEHSGWMRTLACTLVGDRARADDLTQETWVRALEHPPHTDLPLRGWLATVMRNLLRQEHRSAVRRSERELLVAPRQPETREDDGLVVLERVAMQRELVEAVLRLDEPYRTTVLLRYLEELSPKRIAARTGVPVSTVKTRLARGLERLRQQLDTCHGGDGKSWALALLPVVRIPAGLDPGLAFTPFSVGSMLMNSKAIAAVLAVGALGASYLLVQDEEPITASAPVSVEPPELVQESVRTPGVTPELGQVSAEPAGTTRLAIEERRPVEALPESASVETGALVRGRVVDLRGQPVGGVDIVSAWTAGSEDAARGSVVDALGTSLADGTFLLQLETSVGLAVNDPRYTTVMTGVPVTEGTDNEAILVVADRIEVRGHVVDAYGAALVGARVRLVPQGSLRADLGWILDFSGEVDFSTTTDEHGAFSFASAPLFPQGTLRARRKGFLDSLEPAPVVTRQDLTVVLERPAQSPDRLVGVVLDAGGFPAPNTLVSMGIDTTSTDASGEFAFELDDPRSFNTTLSELISIDVGRLIAVKVGHLPAELLATGVDAAGRAMWPNPVVLRLGGEPLSISGRVMDQDGVPLQAMRVWIRDPTFFGGQAREGSSFPRLMQIESELSGLDPGWPFVETGASGTFRLDGLLDRDYVLEALDPRTLMRVETPLIRAGTTGVEIAFSRGDAWETLRGRVLDGAGNPVANATVRINCDAFIRRIQGQVLGTRHASGMVVETDPQGRFEVLDVPKQRVYFRVDHPDIIPVEIGRREDALRELVGENHRDFILLVSRRCHFQLELRRAAEADSFEILDAEGDRLQLSEFDSSGRRDGYRFEIPNGRTNLLAVADSAATLVLYLGTELIRSFPIELVPGQQITLRP